MEALNSWFEHWEPTWLFLLIFAETILAYIGWRIAMRELAILKLEFEYDKQFNEKYVIPKKKFKEKKMAMLPEQSLTDGEAK